MTSEYRTIGIPPMPLSMEASTPHTKLSARRPLPGGIPIAIPEPKTPTREGNSIQKPKSDSKKHHLTLQSFAGPTASEAIAAAGMSYSSILVLLSFPRDSDSKTTK